MCKQLRKHSAQYCVNCQQPWQNVIDHSYIHGSKQPQNQEYGHYQQSPWQQQDWQTHWQTSNARGRTPSPRQRQRPKSAKGNKTPKQEPQQGMPPAQQMMMPTMAPAYMGTMPQMQPMFPNPSMPYPMPMMPGNLPPLPPPPSQNMAKMPAPMPPVPANVGVPTAPTMPTMPAPPLPKMPAVATGSMSEADAEVRGLMSMMRGRQSELPEDMQKKVQKVLTKYGQQTSTDLHAAVTALDNARHNYDQAVLARSQHHAMWKKFLSDAVQLWQTYAAQFMEQEKKLQHEVNVHKETLISAKKDLENSKMAKLDSGDVQNITSDEETEDPEMSAAAQASIKITETMEGLATSLQSLHWEAEAMVAEEAHSAKRQRTGQPKEEEDLPMEPSAPGQSFGKAG